MPETSTYADIRDTPREQRFVHRLPLLLATLALVALVVTSALAPATVKSQTGSWTVAVEHARVTRAGQPVVLRLDVANSARLIEKPVVVEICGSWFDSMDFQNWYPNPAKETRSADTLEYEFDPPMTESLSIALDARAAPGGLGAVLTCPITVTSEEQDLFAGSITTWRLP